MKRRMWLALVLTMVVAGAMIASVGCGGGGEAGGTLQLYIGDPSFIDPSQAFESEGITVINGLFDPLLRYDPLTLAVIPCVAESYDVSEDATVWTFHLKKGTTFHNGREVVAGDFKYAWERLCDPSMGNAYSYLPEMIEGYTEYFIDETADEMSGIKALDDYTLEVTMAEPFGEFDYVVAAAIMGPIPKEEVEGNEEGFGLMPIGNGPFMMTEPWAAGQYIKTVKYADYTTLDQPLIDGIDFNIYSDINTAWVDFQAGTLDWTQIPPGNVKASQETYGTSENGYTSNPGHQVELGEELAFYEMLMNNTDPLLENKDLRVAISLAINRQAICDTVYEGVRKPGTSCVPPGIEGYEADAFPYSHYDVEAAKAALERAGYPGGEGLPVIGLSFNSGAGHDELMQLVKSDLAAIGIETEFDTSDGPTYWDKAENGDYQIGRSGWLADYPTIDDFVTPLYLSTGFLNYCNYDNPEVDAGIREARTIVDKSERIKAYQEVVRTIGEDCPDLIIAVYAHSRVTSDRVHDLTYSAMGLIDYYSVWLEQ